MHRQCGVRDMRKPGSRRVQGSVVAGVGWGCGGSCCPSCGRVQERVLGKTGRTVSVIGLGTWQLGADWGEVADADALATLEAAAQAGVTFLDTADVYGDGRSERLIGRFLAAHLGLPVTVATKMGRRVALDPALYTLANFRAWADRSRANLGTARSTWSSCTAHPRRSTHPARSMTPWISSWPSSASPPTGSAWKPARRP